MNKEYKFIDIYADIYGEKDKSYNNFKKHF